MPARANWSDGALAGQTCFLLVACLVLGGAAQNVTLGDAALQLLSVALLISALQDIISRGAMAYAKMPLFFIALIFFIPILQLLPLPLSIWQYLPGRTVIAETYSLIGQAQTASPMTMTPNATWQSALALLPPVAVFLGASSLGVRWHRTISLVIIAMGVGSVFLGLLQLAQGPHSDLRFYEITNKTEAVGFFANRNHFAALLYVSTLFIGAHCFEALMAYGRRARRTSADFNAVLPLVIWLTALVIVIAGAMMARSRAGLILLALAVLAFVALGVGDHRMKAIRPGFWKAIVAIIVAALLFFVPLALSRILERLGSDPGGDVRIAFARNTISAALTYMPFGSGLGSFVPVYQLFEKTQDMGLSYANHAHNDFLEIWLEAGVPGLLLTGIFFAWVLRRAVVLWRPSAARDYGIDTTLRRAASIALLLLFAHSLVDYPLRTTAMMSVAATAAAFLAAPLRRRHEREAAQSPIAR